MSKLPDDDKNKNIKKETTSTHFEQVVNIENFEVNAFQNELTENFDGKSDEQEFPLGERPEKITEKKDEETKKTLQSDGADLFMEIEDTREHHHHHHHHHGTSHSKSSSHHKKDDNYDASNFVWGKMDTENDYPEFETKKKKKVRGIIVFRNILIGFLAFLLCVAGVIGLLHVKGKNELLDYSDINIEPPQIGDVNTDDNGKTIKYKGKTYNFNDNMTSFLFMGIDREEQLPQDAVAGSTGQADTIILITLDTKTQNVTVVPISRDTIGEYNVYSANNEFLETKKGQICLSYAYGDGRETSCENTVLSVSRLFYNLPINSYFSMDDDGIGMLADAIGGVTVKSMLEYDEWGFHEGETITLFGNKARNYVAFRDTDVLDSNNDRMARQKQFLEEFINQTVSNTKQDVSVPIDLYKVVKNEAVTNISTSKMVYLATNTISKLNTDKDISYKTIEGEVKKGDTGYAEFYPDETKLFELLLDVFYIPQ